MRIAAVVVTCNRPALLRKALAALQAQTRPLDAIYLVDNGGNAGIDGGEDRVREASEGEYTGAHADADTGAGADTDAGTRADAAAGDHAIVDTGAGAGAGTGTDIGADSGAATGAGAGTGTGTDIGADSGAATGADADAGTGNVAALRCRPPATVIVLRSATNLGGAGGFARGMSAAFAAGHDWFWLLDDDAIAAPDALAQLLAALAGAAAGAAAVCGTVREFGGLALRHRRRYHLPTALEWPLPRAAYHGGPCRAGTASFVGFLVASTAVARVGLPERAFFVCYDDTEYTLRLARAGLPLWLAPDSVIEHLREPAARLRAGPFGRKHYFTIRNRMAVARAYATLPAVAAGVTLLFALGLWLASGGVRQRGSAQILLRALEDGYRRRLGPFPDELGGLPACAQRERAAP